jgi:hypothetical protein
MSYITIKLRRGTAAQWTAQNPVLAEGEFGAETDTRKFKIGNGIGAWNSLQYWGGSAGGATLFTDLTDVPQSYTGQGGKLVRVKADSSGLEFYTLTISSGDVTTALGFTPENVANKSLNVDADQASNTKYPSVKAVYQWGINAFTTPLDVLNSITAELVGYATQAWVSSQGYITNVITALGFTPENVANKKTTLSDNSDTFYPSQKAVKTAVDAKQDTLTSGINIKTINGNSVLGSGDLTISAGADILEIQVFS